MTSGLELLPFTVHDTVLQYLDRDYFHSLQAFACVSKTCYLASTHLLFRTIKISISSCSQLSQDVQACSDMLQSASGYRHVRRLIVCGHLNDDDNSDDDFKLQARYARRYSPRISPQDRGYEKHLIGYTWPYIDTETLGADNLIATLYNTNDIWKPLAALVKQLTSLTDLIYECSDQFPSCMLDALHQSQPRCRLYLNTFKLRSLHESETDSYELNLLMSPCLYSIWVQFGRIRYETAQGKADLELQELNYEAIVSLVSGLNPNLKQVHMTYATYATWHKIRYGVRIWKGFLVEKEPVKPSGSLLCLGIASRENSIERKEIEVWKTYTDFAGLESLTIKAGVDQDTLQSLVIIIIVSYSYELTKWL